MFKFYLKLINKTLNKQVTICLFLSGLSIVCGENIARSQEANPAISTPKAGWYVGGSIGINFGEDLSHKVTELNNTINQTLNNQLPASDRTVPVASTPLNTTSNIDGSLNANQQTSLLVNGFIGYQSLPWRTDLEAVIIQDKLNRFNYSGTTNGTNVKFSGTASGDISNTLIMLNGYYDINTNSQWKPFVGGGFGVGNIVLNEQIFDSPQQRINTKGISKSVFAYQVKAGVAYSISNSTDLYLQYRYLGTSNLGDMPGTFNNQPANFSTGGLNYHTIELGARIGI